jgi:hypothetical protein
VASRITFHRITTHGGHSGTQELTAGLWGSALRPVLEDDHCERREGEGEAVGAAGEPAQRDGSAARGGAG